MELSLQTAYATPPGLINRAATTPALQQPLPSDLGPSAVASRPSDQSTAGRIVAAQLSSQMVNDTAMIAKERTLNPYGIIMLPPRKMLANLT